MKAKFKKYFTLIEAALAIAVLAVGATTVITLIPTGVKQAKESLGGNYSAIFADDTYSWISSLSKNDWNAINALPQYSQVFDNNGVPVEVISSTNGLTRVGNTDLFETGHKGVYAISKTSGATTGEDFSAEVLIWQSSPKVDLKNFTSSENTPSEGNGFTVTDGTVVVTQPSNYEIKCIGSEFMSGSTHYAVVLTENVVQPDGTTSTSSPFGPGVADTNDTWLAQDVPEGTSFSGSTYDPYYNRTFDSNDSLHWKVLVNGDEVPTYNAASSQQTPVGTLIAPYTKINPETNRPVMNLLPNQVIYCIDMNVPTTEGTTSMDYQDLVFLATITPSTTQSATTYTINTPENNDIKIVPSNDNYAFDLTTTSGAHFNRNSMQSNKKNDDYLYPGQTFSVTNLKLKTTGSDALLVNDQSINLQNKNITLNAPADDPMELQVWRESSGLGEWHFAIVGGNSTSIVADDGTNLNLPAVSSNTNNSSSNNGSGDNEQVKKAVGVNVEISWPLHQQNYALREKLRYYLEVYDMKNIGVASEEQQ